MELAVQAAKVKDRLNLNNILVVTLNQRCTRSSKVSMMEHTPSRDHPPSTKRTSAGTRGRNIGTVSACSRRKSLPSSSRCMLMLRPETGSPILFKNRVQKVKLTELNSHRRTWFLTDQAYGSDWHIQTNLTVIDEYGFRKIRPTDQTDTYKRT